MSKRFGRNQKRRLLDAMSGMERTNQALAKQMVACQREVVGLRDTLRGIYSEICEVFNEYHPLMNKSMRVDRPDMERMQVRTVSAIPFDIDPHSANRTSPVECASRTAYMLRLESWPDEYKHAITFKATHNGRMVAYYADDIRMIRDEKAIPYIAEEIARNLIKTLKGGRR